MELFDVVFSFVNIRLSNDAEELFAFISMWLFHVVMWLHFMMHCDEETLTLLYVNISSLLESFCRELLASDIQMDKVTISQLALDQLTFKCQDAVT